MTSAAPLPKYAISSVEIIFNTQDIGAELVSSMLIKNFY